MDYQIWLCTDTGSRIASLNNWLWLDAMRGENGSGDFALGLSGEFDRSLVELDRIVQVWRAPTDGRLSLYGCYFIRSWGAQTRNGETQFTIGGPECAELLDRRIIAYDEGETESEKTDYADDMMKEIVDENMVSASDTDRNWSRVSVAAELSAGDTLTMQFSRQSVRDALNDIAQASRVAGTEVFYNLEPVVAPAAITFQFVTRTGQPGRDLTNSGVIFDQARGNLANPALEYDYSDTETYVYGVGRGDGDDQETQTASDTERIGLSTWNRREGFVSAYTSDEANAVREAARARLADRQPHRRFSGGLLDTDQLRFGRDWNWGDLVSIRYDNTTFSAIVRAVRLYANNQGEQITAYLGEES